MPASSPWPRRAEAGRRSGRSSSTCHSWLKPIIATTISRSWTGHEDQGQRAEQVLGQGGGVEAVLVAREPIRRRDRGEDREDDRQRGHHRQDAAVPAHDQKREEDVKAGPEDRHHSDAGALQPLPAAEGDDQQQRGAHQKHEGDDRLHRLRLGLDAVRAPELVPRAGNHALHRRKHKRGGGSARRSAPGPMRAEGLEPTRSHEHQVLSLACLPIPARPRTRDSLRLTASAVGAIITNVRSMTRPKGAIGPRYGRWSPAGSATARRPGEPASLGRRCGIGDTGGCPAHAPGGPLPKMRRLRAAPVAGAVLVRIGSLSRRWLHLPA